MATTKADGSVRIKATLADGRVFVGPIQGRGGRIGDATLHLGFEAAAQAAMEALRGIKRRCTTGRPLGVYEPKPGHLAIYPHESAESAGEPELVPVRGTEFTVDSELWFGRA